MELRTYSWEIPQASFSWERSLGHDLDVGSDEASDASSASEDIEDLSPAPQATALLAEYLVELKMTGKLKAAHIWCIAYYCKLMGCDEAISKFSFRPDAPSGNYQRHLDNVLRVVLEPPPICVDVPGCSKTF